MSTWRLARNQNHSSVASAAAPSFAALALALFETVACACDLKNWPSISSATDFKVFGTGAVWRITVGSSPARMALVHF